MGKTRNKEVGTTSEQPPFEKRILKPLKAAKKISKDSSEGNSEISEKANTKDSKTTKDIAIKVNGSTQVNEQREANAKEKEENTRETIGGLIFMCSAKTKPDCFHYKVLGLPENRKEFVLHIKPGMRLFLYDFDLKLLYGIFKASSHGGMKLEPAAFNGSYPAQVRFEVKRACSPLPFHIFKHAIKDNFTGIRNMFKTELSIEQVKDLTKLFKSSPQQQSIVNKDALVPVQVLAPVPTPVAILWPPTMLPSDGLPLPQRQIIQAPIGTMPRDPRSLNEQDYVNLGLHPIPLVSSATAHGNAPDPYADPFRATGPYGTKINHQHDRPQLRLDMVDSSLRPLPLSQQAPHVRSPYVVPRMSNFDLAASSGDARLGEKHQIRAQNTLSGYVNRISLPVSSRYAFAGPSMSYRRGHTS